MKTLNLTKFLEIFFRVNTLNTGLKIKVIKNRINIILGKYHNVMLKTKDNRSFMAQQFMLSGCYLTAARKNVRVKYSLLQLGKTNLLMKELGNFKRVACNE